MTTNTNKEGLIRQLELHVKRLKTFEDTKKKMMEYGSKSLSFVEINNVIDAEKEEINAIKWLIANHGEMKQDQDNR
jgi:hypothetical protein